MRTTLYYDASACVLNVYIFIFINCESEQQLLYVT